MLRFSSSIAPLILIFAGTLTIGCDKNSGKGANDSNDSSLVPSDSSSQQKVDITGVGSPDGHIKGEGGLTKNDSSGNKDSQGSNKSDSGGALSDSGGTLPGCDSAPQFSCFFTVEKWCVEYSGIPQAQAQEMIPLLQAGCDGDGDTSSLSGCPRKDTIGACQAPWEGGDSGCTALWYYPASGGTAMSHKADCLKAKGIWIDP